MATSESDAARPTAEGTTTRHRMFVAIELPVAVLEEVEVAIRAMRAEAPELAWTNTLNRHITLKFLSDVEAERVEGVALKLDEVGRAHRPFSIQLSHIGAFPNFRRARVVWLGVEPEPRLELLQHDLELAAEGIGFELEGRPFRPHLTLARVKAPLDVDRTRRFARAARKVDFTATVHCTEMILFESTLAPSGARYRRVHAATLGGR